MKKYIEPVITVQEIEEDVEFIATSPIAQYEDIGDEGNYSKHIDFSDSESIW